MAYPLDFTKGNSFNDKPGNNYLLGDYIFGGSDSNNAKSDDLIVIDKDWVETRFMVSDIDLDPVDAMNRYYSSAENKFTDSSIGGNIGINARPQFTPYCDIPVRGRIASNVLPTINDRTGRTGMGRYYSESIDDNQQLVFLEFGVPKFNSLFDFFTKAVNYKDSILANTGRQPYAYTAGQLTGGLVMLAAFPLITLVIWTGKTVFGLIAGHNSFNYYYLDPMMHSYWATVNTIVTQMATEMGILAPELMDTEDTAERIGLKVQINQDDINQMKKLMPGIIGDNNYIDVFAIATKAQALANTQMLVDIEYAKENQNSAFDYQGYVKTKYSVSESKAAGTTLIDKFNTATMFSAYLGKTVKKVDGYYYDADTGDKPIDKEQISGGSTSVVGGAVKNSLENKDFKKDVNGFYPAAKTPETDRITKFANALDSAARDGAMHAIFRVDYTGSVTESFNNSTGSIETGDTLKSLSKKSRDVKFSFSGGNIAGDTLHTAAGYAKDFLAGTLDSITFGASNVLQTFMGGGYIDIPRKWDDSSINLPQVSYSMQLVSPYGNTISQLQNIYIPLAMLLAGTLPLATGKASYTSPFICSLFSKGVQNVKLGMITSLTITRGTSNLGFTKDRKALAINVSFTVTDFSNIIAAPVNSSIFDNIFSVSLEDDTPLSNYIATLSSRSLLTNKYTIPKIKLRYSRALMNFEQAISPSSWGLRGGESINGLLGGFTSQKNLTFGTS